MTNAELLAKIKAEIDKLYGEYKDKFHQIGDQYHLGLIDGLDMAEQVLSTLESEKPIEQDDSEIPTNLDLEKELMELCDGTMSLTSMDIARHFYELGRSGKPMNQEGLEEEIKRYYSENFDYISSNQPTLSILTNIARHFAKWGAEHLKK